MLIFSNEAQVDKWSKQYNIPKGDVQPIEKIWQFSKKWYGGHLKKDWKKRTIEEAKQLFAEFSFENEIWNLDDKTGRF